MVRTIELTVDLTVKSGGRQQDLKRRVADQAANW